MRPHETNTMGKNENGSQLLSPQSALPPRTRCQPVSAGSWVCCRTVPGTTHATGVGVCDSLSRDCLLLLAAKPAPMIEHALLHSVPLSLPCRCSRRAALYSLHVTRRRRLNSWLTSRHPSISRAMRVHHDGADDAAPPLIPVSTGLAPNLGDEPAEPGLTGGHDAPCRLRPLST